MTATKRIGFDITDLDNIHTPGIRCSISYCGNLANWIVGGHPLCTSCKESAEDES